MPKIIRIADCVAQPWKNGAGSTRELFKLSSKAGDTLVRISIAELSGSQAFSNFPDIDRIIMQLDGPPMTLTIDGQEHELGIGKPLPFAGESKVTCDLDGKGPAHDLNLMCARDHYAAGMQVESKEAGAALKSHGSTNITALLALQPLSLQVAGEKIELAVRDMVVIDDGQQVTFHTAGRFVRLEAMPFT